MRFPNVRAAPLTLALTVAALVACDRGGAARLESKSRGPRIELVADDGKPPIVVAFGVTDADAGPPERRRLVVRVSPDAPLPIDGKYVRASDRIEFRPTFPLDPGRTYSAELRLADTIIRTTLTVPGTNRSATTLIVRSTPTTDSVPENLLRMYLEFSDSMSRQSGVEHIHLLDDTGREIQHAFLPLEGDFWNPAHTRYTVFFDPGRVKRGILPNEEMGRPLRAGHAYTLVVDSTWRDAHGQPLARSYRRPLVATPAVVAPITLGQWSVTAPKAGTRDSLIVVFPRSLDRGLIDRAIGVETANGKAVSGAAAVEAGERRWAFAPRAAWGRDAYRIVVLSILEDVAGNQVNHAFEVDLFERVDSTSQATRYTISFTIR